MKVWSKICDVTDSQTLTVCGLHWMDEDTYTWIINIHNRMVNTYLITDLSKSRKCTIQRWNIYNNNDIYIYNIIFHLHFETVSCVIMMRKYQVLIFFLNTIWFYHPHLHLRTFEILLRKYNTTFGHSCITRFLCFARFTLEKHHFHNANIRR